MCAASGGGRPLLGMPTLILPPPTFTDVASSALKGAWSHVISQESRDLYENMVSTGVIKDTVLHQAKNGSILTYSLFHNLQNPLLSKYGFDAREFVSAVGPALENLHETLGRLRNQLSESSEKEETEKMFEEIRRAKELDPIEAVLGANDWRKQAEDDKDSDAGVLSRMTSETCFDTLFYTSKLSLSEGNMSVEASAVTEVALLSARADVVAGGGNGDSALEYEEFRATDELSGDAPIGAQMDVLFEVTYTFKSQQPAELDSSGTIKEKDEEGEKHVDNKGAETISITNLAVAIFEGFLHKKGEDLRWKVALVREAYEFPHSVSSVTRQ